MADYGGISMGKRTGCEEQGDNQRDPLPIYKSTIPRPFDTGMVLIPRVLRILYF